MLVDRVVQCIDSGFDTLISGSYVSSAEGNAKQSLSNLSPQFSRRSTYNKAFVFPFEWTEHLAGVVCLRLT